MFLFHSFIILGKLRVIDLEHVVFVNQSNVREVAAPGWDIQHTNFVDNDETNNKINFNYSLEDLCTHEVSDLNFYGACQWILSSSTSTEKGLLYDAADVQDKFPLLPKLLNECSRPSNLVPGARQEAAKLIIDILKQI